MAFSYDYYTLESLPLFIRSLSSWTRVVPCGLLLTLISLLTEPASIYDHTGILYFKAIGENTVHSITVLYTGMNNEWHFGVQENNYYVQENIGKQVKKNP